MNIIGICGSLREGSHNRRLLEASRLLIEGRNSSLQIYDLSDVPLYNSDLDGPEKPAAVGRLLAAISAAHAILFATPEYNYSMSGVLKNAIDWASRPAFKSVLAGRPSAIVSASMSPQGGARAQVHLRDVLSGTLTPVFPAPHFLLASAHQAFDKSGALSDDGAAKRLERYLDEFLGWAAKQPPPAS